MEENSTPSNFIRTIIDEDLKNGKHKTVITRFPPEPNGYLHIGHAKSICLNFAIAQDYQGVCHMRFDDTNPVKEEVEYLESILEDIRWLGFDWGKNLFYASDYFERLYQGALKLIEKNLAYVCDLDAEDVRKYRGTLTEPGKNSPYRNRSVEENLDLFQRMRDGEFPDGSRLLRAKIDMSSPNMNMRDPALYRIRKVEHHRTANKWCIYPMYDYTHCVSDALENITHSLCTLEFEDHRPLYDWVLEVLDWPQPRPQQIEFARLNLEYCLMSKRRLIKLVEDKHVEGWNDPRMITLSGLRRRGFTPESIKLFCDRIGVAKRDSWIEMEWLEKAIRDDLNTTTPRVMAVLDPLKVVIENWPEGKKETISAPYFPDDPSKMGNRDLIMSREIYIEQDDFMLEAPKKFYRLIVGREVRLRWAYYIHCHEAICDENGKVVELRCTYSDTPKGDNKIKGRNRPSIIHWVPKEDSIAFEARLFDRLFKVARPDGDKVEEELNPDSKIIKKQARLEPSLKNVGPDFRCQFERLGFFYPDSVDHNKDNIVFNRIVTLRDSWAKIKKAKI